MLLPPFPHSNKRYRNVYLKDTRPLLPENDPILISFRRVFRSCQTPPPAEEARIIFQHRGQRRAPINVRPPPTFSSPPTPHPPPTSAPTPAPARGQGLPAAANAATAIAPSRRPGRNAGPAATYTAPLWWTWCCPDAKALPQNLCRVSSLAPPAMLRGKERIPPTPTPSLSPSLRPVSLPFGQNAHQIAEFGPGRLGNRPRRNGWDLIGGQRLPVRPLLELPALMWAGRPKGGSKLRLLVKWENGLDRGRRISIHKAHRGDGCFPEKSLLKCRSPRPFGSPIGVLRACKSCSGSSPGVSAV